MSLRDCFVAAFLAKTCELMSLRAYFAKQSLLSSPRDCFVAVLLAKTWDLSLRAGVLPAKQSLWSLVRRLLRHSVPRKDMRVNVIASVLCEAISVIVTARLLRRFAPRKDKGFVIASRCSSGEAISVVAGQEIASSLRSSQ